MVATFVAAVVLVAALVAVVPSPQPERTRATCAMLAQIRPSLFNGSRDGEAVRTELRDMAEVAQGAETGVATAVGVLAAQPQLGGPDFDRALTAADDACRLAG